MNISPIKVGEMLWRSNPADYLAQRTGTPVANATVGEDRVSISNEATVMAELQKMTSPGGSGGLENLLTDQEKETLNKISSNYNGNQDEQVGNLGLSLALDKLMAKLSNTEPPVLNKDYLSQIQEKTGATGTLYSRLDTHFLADLIENFDSAIS